MPTTTPQQLVGAILSAGLIPALAGPPGVGKTAMCRAWANDTDRRFALIDLGPCDPTDIGGLPLITTDGSVVRAPMKILADLAADPSPALLVLDDLTAASPAVQAATLRLLLERQAGDLSLGAHVALAVTYNPADQGGLHDLEDPVAGRLVHVEVDADPTTVIAGFLGSWPSTPVFPTPTPDAVAQWRRTIAGFLTVNPRQTLATTASPAAPSPRTWDFAASLAATVHRHGDDDLLVSVIAAAVGHGAALEFATWHAERDLPDPAALIASPANVRISDTARPDRTLLVAETLTDHALHAGEPDITETVWGLLATAVEDGQGDLVLPAARRLTQAPRSNRPFPPAAMPLLDLLGAA